jgi:hypothetical protein
MLVLVFARAVADAELIHLSWEPNPLVVYSDNGNSSVVFSRSEADMLLEQENSLEGLGDVLELQHI